MRILSLTSSLSGCEKNWSTFEAVHMKKRNRLERNRLNNLVYIIDGDDGDGDEVDTESVMEAIDEAPNTNDNQVPHKSSTTREFYNEDFESENEEQVFEEDEYESDGVKIVEELED
ncbi:unnamed protein product [Lactuca saligna]|uniref:HAT C-terminal dimerisation domain-containing protein n=1 Tax=Lactuca saligna TaxID=75948 RepID=A0AA35YCR8_LACSI|nr:unnamed protein product [Lactuca saligna]